MWVSMLVSNFCKFSVRCPFIRNFLIATPRPLKNWWQGNLKQQVSDSNNNLFIESKGRLIFSHLVLKSKVKGHSFSVLCKTILFSSQTNKKIPPSSFKTHVFVRTEWLTFTGHYHVTGTVWRTSHALAHWTLGEKFITTIFQMWKLTFRKVKWLAHTQF